MKKSNRFVKRWGRLLTIGVLVIAALVAVYFFRISADTNSQSLIRVIRGSLMNDSREEGEILNVNLAQGETKSVAIWLENPGSSEFKSLTIKKDNIQNVSHGVFPKENIDERIAYTWRQKIADLNTGRGTLNFANMLELLVKTNKINYMAEDITMNDLPNSDGYMPGQGKNETDFLLRAGSNQKVILRISAPQRTGVYNGPINVIDKLTGVTVGSIQIKINVTGVKLVQPFQKDFTPGCYVNDRVIGQGKDVPVGREDYYVSREVFRNRMDMIHRIGCESVILHVTAKDDYLWEIKLLQDLGFKGKLVLNYRYLNSQNADIKNDTLQSQDSKNQFEDIVRTILDDSQITKKIAFYGVDEPNAPNTTYPDHLLRVKNTKDILDKIASDRSLRSIEREVSTALISDIFLKMNSEADQDYHSSSPIINYIAKCENIGIPGLDCQTDASKLFEKFKSGEVSKPSGISYYFQGSREQPIQNRYLGGLALIRSGLKNYYLNPIWGFYARVVPIFSEDSFDQNLAAKKQNMTLYPASNGLMPTIQSEAWHEGVMDLKYYLTYLEYKKEVSEKCESAQRSRLNEISDAIEIGSEAMLNLGHEFPEFNLDNLRSKLESYVYYFDTYCSGKDPNPVLIDDLEFTAKPGFTSLGAEGKIKISDLVRQGLSVWRFNANISNEWQKYSAEQNGDEISSGNGFYVHNPSSTKQVVLPQTGQETVGTIKAGWNLLWAKKLSDS